MTRLDALQAEAVTVAIVGSRDYPHPERVRALVRWLRSDCRVVSGGARGVDRWAAEEARARGLEVVEVLPDWDRHGRAAGMIRNSEIVRLADWVVAFWDGKSRGTRDTIEKARQAGKLAFVVRLREEEPA